MTPRQHSTEAVLSIAREMGIDAAEIEHRKLFLEFTEKDAHLLTELHTRLKQAEKGFVDDFYAHLLKFTDTQAFIPDEATLTHLKRTQAAYFESLTAGEYGWAYVLDRLRVGLAHEDIGLKPQWYIGAYNKYLGSLFPLMQQLMPDTDDAIHACQALLKIVLFDVNLALDTYFHADKRRWEQLHAALNAVLEVVFLFRPDNLQIVYANHGAAYTLGYSEEEIQTMTPLAFMANDDEAHFRTAINRLVDGRETFTRIDTNLLCQKEGAIPVELFLQHIKAAAGPGLVVGIARDVSDYIKHQEKLEHMALHDSLTELANRRMLHREVEKAINSGQNIALLFIGLDRFKVINETIGFSTGDMVLLKITDRLKLVQAACSDYLLARVGGDTFALLAPFSTMDEAISLASDCQAVLQPTLQFGEFALDIQSTIGIALYPSHEAGDADELLRQAGVAMRAARRTRTDITSYSAELEKYQVENLNLAGELRRAIENDELTLYFQPKVDMKSGRITSVEALVRWIHPERGFLPPDLFIPLAEESALIYGLTEWVIRQAMRQHKSWQQAGLPDDFHISVNVTAADLENADFIEIIHRYAEESGIKPGALVLEITESGLMHDPERAHETLHRLHDIGMQLSIDDFGTGYSSLAYLKDLPVQELKIDHSFVRHMLENEKNAAIVHATVTLAHDLDLRVVAEGVEDEATWNHLADLGCDKAQGYYMGKPMPSDELEKWFRESPWGLNS